MAKTYNFDMSEETFAAWLDGAMSPEQDVMFLDACSHNEELQELLDANDQIDEDYESFVESGVVLPPEFEKDFDIPQIIDVSNDEDLYSYNQIEPYEQDESENQDDEEYSNSDDCGYEINSGLENDFETNESIDAFEII